MSVPKSMRYWMEKHGIYQRKAFGHHRRWRAGGGCLYSTSTRKRFTQGIKDDRRHFRAVGNHLEICDGYFDRWANSCGYTVPMPQTEAEFEAALDILVKNSNLCGVEQRVSIYLTDAYRA